MMDLFNKYELKGYNL